MMLYKTGNHHVNKRGYSSIYSEVANRLARQVFLSRNIQKTVIFQVKLQEVPVYSKNEEDERWTDPALFGH